jgi:hypothetical protein
MAAGLHLKLSHAQVAPADSARLRQFLLLILLIESLSIGAELLLLAHTEDPWQWVPLALILGCTLALAWCAIHPGPAAVRALQGLMALFVLSGILGVFLHFRAKTEFQLEVNPSLQGSALFWEAVKSQSPPTLAPGIMIQMGLLGFAYAYRHPALRGLAQQEKTG